MDPARASLTSHAARQTVIVGASGSAWSFVPRKQPGTFFFEYDPQRSAVVWSSGNSIEVLGLTEAACTPHGAFLLAHLHTADRYRVETSLSSAFSAMQTFMTTYRWHRPDSNEVRVLHCRGMLDSESQLFRGFIIDLSSELVVLQNSGEVLSSVSFTMDQLAMCGFVLDLELRVRSIHGQLDDNKLSLGFGTAHSSTLRPGSHITSAFIEEASRSRLRDVLTEALATGQKECAWATYRAEMKCISYEGTPQGLSIVVFDNLQKIDLERTKDELLSVSSSFADQAGLVTKLLDLGQEMVGYAALISRNTSNNPLLRHTSEALVTTAKESAQRANELLRMTHHATKTQHEVSVTPHSPVHLHAPASLTRGYVRTIETLIASNTLRSAQTLSALLRDAGLGCLSTRLSEPDLKECFQQHPHLRVAVLDLSGEIQHDALLVRRLRRFFPATQIIVLIHDGTDTAEKLRRAGAIAVLGKPVTPKEIERAIKALL